MFTGSCKSLTVPLSFVQLIKPSYESTIMARGVGFESIRLSWGLYYLRNLLDTVNGIQSLVIKTESNPLCSRRHKVSI
jgi:hypothetical protein